MQLFPSEVGLEPGATSISSDQELFRDVLKPGYVNQRIEGLKKRMKKKNADTTEATPTTTTSSQF